MSPAKTMTFSAFHLYGFILGLGLVSGYLLSRRLVIKKKMDVDFFDKFFWGLIFGGVVGARLYHVVDLWPYYSFRPLEILTIWNGGLAIYGAILGSGVACFSQLAISGRARKFFDWADVLVPGALLAQVIGRWGNYVNQEAFGPPTNLPWAVFIVPGSRPSAVIEFSYFHPLFLYESLWNILGLFILLRFRQLLNVRGRPTSFYLIWYGVGRFFYEFGRYDTAVFSGYKVAQIFSIGAVVLGFVFLVWTMKGRMGKIMTVVS